MAEQSKNRMRRAWLWTATMVAALVGGGYALVGCLAGPAHQGPKTVHFDGDRFSAPEPMPDKSFWTVLKWRLTREAAEWEDRLDEPPGPPPPRRVSEPGRVRVTWVNHATVLLQTDGVNILTDPIYSERASPVSWAGPRRHRRPGIRFDDLPPVDLVIISHNHYDHLDLPTLERLAEAHRPRILVPLGNLPLLEQAGIAGGRAVDWQQTAQVGRLRVTYLPVQHWSGRGLSDRNKTLWGGYVIESSGGPIYFAGDTGWGSHFEAAYQRYGPMRLALLPIGAYEPRWFMRAAHISPTEAVAAHLTLRAQTSIGIHYGTFELSDEGQDAPVIALRAALVRQGLSEEQFWLLAHGEGRELPGARLARATGREASVAAR